MLQKRFRVRNLMGGYAYIEAYREYEASLKEMIREIVKGFLKAP